MAIRISNDSSHLFILGPDHTHHLKKDIFFLLLFIILLFSLPSPKINKLPDSSSYKIV